MKIFLHEFGHHYKKYLFGYTLHALREQNDLFNDLFAKGFLPYTGDTAIKNTYYMARSCRIELEKFSLSSENRRIQKKILPGTFIKTKHSPEELINNDHFIKFCIDYFTNRHGPDIFSKERLQFVLSFSNEVHVIKYANTQGDAMAYVIETQGKDAAQYWFSFYDLNALAHVGVPFSIQINFPP